MFTQSLISLVALSVFIPTALAVPGPAWIRRQNDAQSSFTLDPATISQGLEQDGQGANPDPGQVRSLTSSNNYINFCLGPLANGVPLTNGKQIATGSCNQTPMGRIISLDKAPRSKFVFPKNGDESIVENKAFTVQMKILNMQTGNFVAATTNYYAAPQQVNDQGIVIGHSHVVIEKLPSLQSTEPLDPTTFAFFKGLNNVAANDILSADVTSGLAAGVYRVCSINTAANHQPCLVSNAQHGSLDDCSYFTVVPANGANASASSASSAAASATQTEASTTRANESSATESNSATATQSANNGNENESSSTASDATGTGSSDAPAATETSSSDSNAQPSSTDAAASSSSDSSSEAAAPTQGNNDQGNNQNQDQGNNQNQDQGNNQNQDGQNQDQGNAPSSSADSSSAPAPTETPQGGDNQNGQNGQNGNDQGNNNNNNNNQQGSDSQAPAAPAPSDAAPAPQGGDNQNQGGQNQGNDQQAPAAPAPSDAAPAPAPQGGDNQQNGGNDQGATNNNGPSDAAPPATTQ